ncbi:MAG: VOC family protein [Anaerolineae bacterium]|nr:VOC family protein [Anaerolineae bacterium]
MYIEHVAVWTKNLEQLKTFYETYFQASVGKKYLNPNKQFESYFLTFTSGARLELMYRPTIPPSLDDVEKQFTGYIHLAIAVGSEAKVDDLTAWLQEDGFRVIDGPRHTGDGYYESCVLDPDGNRIEITV